MRDLCQHAIAKGQTNAARVSWWWCQVRAVQITPEKHCSEECVSFKAREDEESMPGIKGIGWDRPASETVDGAPEETLLWAWGQQQLESGEYGALARTARAIGCDGNSLKSAISRRATRAARAPAELDLTSEAGKTPSPGATPGKAEGATATTQQRAELERKRSAAAGATREERDADMERRAAALGKGSLEEQLAKAHEDVAATLATSSEQGSDLKPAPGETADVVVDTGIASASEDELLAVPQEALVEFLRIEGMGHEAACFSAGWIAHELSVEQEPVAT